MKDRHFWKDRKKNRTGQRNRSVMKAGAEQRGVREGILAAGLACVGARWRLFSCLAHGVWIQAVLELGVSGDVTPYSTQQDLP